MASKQALEAKARIEAGIKAMEEEKSAPVIRFPNQGIKVTQYQGYAKPARGLEPTTPMSNLERAANYRVKGGRTNLDPEVAQIYSPK